MQKLHAIGRRDDGKIFHYNLMPIIERFFAVQGVEPHAIELKIEDVSDKSERPQPTQNKE